MKNFTIDELNNIGIREWSVIKKQFSPASILLGNGFSINFSDSLRYNRLYEYFISVCSDPVKDLFKSFNTNDFEMVLHNVEIAMVVCRTLGIDIKELVKVHSEIREGLIDSINRIHPEPIDIDQTKILWIKEQFDDFDQIFTTNYDLFLYYIILKTNNFGDHFFNEHSTHYNSFDIPDKYKNNHIYYLHGALFLFENNIKTLKILKREEECLLRTITREINQNNYPLFISEGNSINKIKSIRSNAYLSFCMQKLETNQNKILVIFGQSLSKQDEHIVKAIDENYSKVAISIWVDGYKSIKEVQSEKNRIVALFKNPVLEFYDAKSLFNFASNFNLTFF